MQKNNAWDLVPLSSIPRDVKPIGSRWVFRIKYNNDGTINKYKARIVAKGYTLVVGIDYKATFAPDVCTASLRLLFSIGASRDLEIHHIDVTTAFLLAPLDETIYMQCPPGMHSAGMVCKLRKSLYGLKQAPHVWHATLSNHLKTHGWISFPSEPCIFHKPASDMFIGLYVDDMPILAPTLSQIDDIKDLISSAFPISDLGPIHHLLGYEVRRNRTKKTLSMFQTTFINEILDVSGVPASDLYPVVTPIDGNTIFLPDASALPSSIPYRSVVGKLIYLANGTRPDIAHAVSTLCRFFNNPGLSHWEAVKRLLRYLYGTKHMGITLGCADSHNQLSIYVDASDGDDRIREKSRTGFICLLDTAPIFWQSSLQSLPTLSSTESELVALTEAARQNIWIRDLMLDFGLFNLQPTNILEDNMSTIHLVKNSTNNARTRPLNRRRHFVQHEWLIARSLTLRHYPSHHQIADSLTKYVSRSLFRDHRDHLLGCPSTCRL